jgi:hypothetical protein
MDKTVDELAKELERLLTIQTTNGNWDHSPYMHGMANGIIFSLSVLTGEDPKFLDAPDMFSCDVKDLDKFNQSSTVIDNKPECSK